MRASLFAVLTAFAACGPAQRNEPAAPAPDPVELVAPAPAPVTAVPAAAATAPVSAPAGVAQVFVAEHNRDRAKHCAPPLTWSPELAAVAQQWADALKAKGCMFGHSNTKYGENLAAGTTGAMPPETVVAMWYDEVAKYSFAKPGFSMDTGHFTQVVWTDTKSVGCGMSQCKGMDIWVCNYDPPGNWDGQFPEHVLPTSCKK